MIGSFCRNKQLADLASKQGTSYIGAVVLGLNDALVELTGALAGFTMSLPNTRSIVMAGLTTGIAATLSMASAEYLAQRHQAAFGTPYKAAIATGVTYLLTTVLLLMPFVCFTSALVALTITITIAISIIFIFTLYVSHIYCTPFWKGFLEMLVISICVAALCFFLSWGANILYGVNL